MNNPILRIEGVGKYFLNADKTPIWVLKDVNFTLNRSEKVAVCGESGSGKTTFLFLLGRLENVNEGRIFWDETPLDSLSEIDILRKRCRFVSYIFQNYLLIEEISVIENILLPIRMQKKAIGLETSKKALTWLERLGMSRKAKYSPRLLSGGERQRVAIARALMANSKVILADEPTGNLDEKTGESVMHWLLDTCEQEGSSLVLVTHNQQFASKMDRVYHLREGKLSL